jgi:phytoene dehydrogenase-like protein
MGRTTIVIGAGPNGLTAATLLAKAGHTVTVIERRDIPGGIAAGETFHDGFTTTGLVHESCHVRPRVADALGLTRHGLEWRDVPALFGCVEEGEGLLLPTDDSGASAAISGHDSASDYAGYSRWLNKVVPLAKQLLENRAPAIGQTSDLWPLLKTALGVRMLGERDMMELLRIAPSCVDDWLEEHFPSPLVRSMLMGPALFGSWMGPRSPTSALCLLVYKALAGREVAGGPAALVRALVSAANAAGVTLRHGAEVTGITVADGAVTGVTLADGAAMSADTVVSAIGPRKTLLDLVDPLWLPPTDTGEAQNIRTRGITAKVHLAISGELRAAGDGQAAERLWIGAHPLDLERAFDDAKMRVLPRAPVLDVRVPSLSDASLAPAGHHVVSVLVHGAACDLDAGWDDAARDALKAAVMSQLTRYTDLTEERVLACEVLTPAEIAGRYGLEGAHVWHGELGLDQLWTLRPTRRTSQHATPIAGLFLGSGGAHGGGALTCAAGALCAKAVTSAKG